jgi:hypothetical protein
MGYGDLVHTRIRLYSSGSPRVNYFSLVQIKQHAYQRNGGTVPLLILLFGITLGTALLTVGFIAEVGVLTVLGVLTVGSSVVMGLQQATSNSTPVIEPQAVTLQVERATAQPKAGLSLAGDSTLALAVAGMALAAVLLTTGFVIEHGLVTILGLFVMGGSIVGGLIRATNP